jgi:hypothetical protein
MLKIWKRGNSFSLNCSWQGGKSKDDFTLTNIHQRYGEPIENTPEIIDFKDKYNLFKTKKVDIKEEDVIYFFKESKYPRFKFTSNCKNLKTIQIPKATWLVTPMIEFFSRNATVNIGVECLLTNRIYFYNYNGSVQNSQKLTTLYNKSTIIESFICLLQDKFLIQGNNYREVECLQLANYNKYNVDVINDIYDNIDKCITEENLEEYITSKNSNELNDELYKSLDTMLKSKDATTIELGIKMLNNFDIKKYALQVGSLLRLNSSHITYNKALTTVGFKNVLSQLNTDWNSLSNSDNLVYYDKLYRSSSTNEDKLQIKDYYKKEVKHRVQMTYDSCIQNKSIPSELILEVN